MNPDANMSWETIKMYSMDTWISPQSDTWLNENKKLWKLHCNQLRESIYYLNKYESKYISVKDTIPNSRLARFYGNFCYDEYRESMYRPCNETMCSTSNLSYYKIDEYWMIPEVVNLYNKSTKPIIQKQTCKQSEFKKNYEDSSKVDSRKDSLPEAVENIIKYKRNINNAADTQFCRNKAVESNTAFQKVNNNQKYKPPNAFNKQKSTDKSKLVWYNQSIPICNQLTLKLNENNETVNTNSNNIQFDLQTGIESLSVVHNAKSQSVYQKFVDNLDHKKTPNKKNKKQKLNNSKGSISPYKIDAKKATNKKHRFVEERKDKSLERE